MAVAGEGAGRISNSGAFSMMVQQKDRDGLVLEVASIHYYSEKT